MSKRLSVFLLLCAGILQACGPAASPAQQQAREHQIACAAGTIGGALIGGAIGNQFGGGSGKDILTAAGASVGALSGQSYACG